MSEVAARLGLHKSTVSRMFAVLEDEGLVEQDSTNRRYQLGLGLIELAGPLLADLDVRRAAYPELRELAGSTGETAALMIFDHAQAVCVEQVSSPQEVKHTTSLGTRYDTALSASVQVFLAELDPSETDALIAAGRVRLDGADEQGRLDYLERLDDVRRRGVPLNYGETAVSEVGVAPPVRDHRGDAVAAVLLSAPRFRVTEDLLGHARRLRSQRRRARVPPPRTSTTTDRVTADRARTVIDSVSAPVDPGTAPAPQRTQHREILGLTEVG